MATHDSLFLCELSEHKIPPQTKWLKMVTILLFLMILWLVGWFFWLWAKSADLCSQLAAQQRPPGRMVPFMSDTWLCVSWGNRHAIAIVSHYLAGLVSLAVHVTVVAVFPKQQESNLRCARAFQLLLVSHLLMSR